MLSLHGLMTARSPASLPRFAPRLLILVLALTLATAGLLPARGQVRPVVLDDPSRPRPLVEPPLFPPRQAALESLWNVPSGGTVIDGFLAGPGGIIYAVREGTVRFLAPKTGELIWSRDLGEALRFAPLGSRGRVFLVRGQSLEALAATDGRTLWNVPLPAPPVFAPTTDGTRIVSTLEKGTVASFAAETGKVIWVGQTGCEASSPAGLGSGLVVVGCEDGRLAGLDAASGRVKWLRQSRARIRTRPLVLGHSILTGNDAGEFISWGSKHGRRRFTAHIAADALASPVRHRNLVLVGGLDNLLYGFRLRSGFLAWSADVGTRVLTPPATRAFVAVNFPPLATKIVTVDTRDGTILAETPVEEKGQVSAAGPVFAGAVLVCSTRSLAGGPGRVAGFKVEVKELPYQPLAYRSDRRPGSILP